MKPKYTKRDLKKAIEVIRQFEDEYKIERSKLHRKEGIAYTECQHLTEGTQTQEEYALWTGDKMRIILCPICAKEHMGNALANIFTYIRFNDPDVKTFLESMGEDMTRYQFFNNAPMTDVSMQMLMKKSQWVQRIFKDWFLK